MSYCVIERSSDDSFRVPVQGVYSTREAARDAVGLALSEGRVVITGDVYVVDLERGVTPILVVTLSEPSYAAGITEVNKEITAVSEPTISEEALLEEERVCDAAPVEASMSDMSVGMVEELLDAASEIEWGNEILDGNNGVSCTSMHHQAAQPSDDERIMRPVLLESDLQLETYSCADCVYINTCPKAGQTSPVKCGAFQWRSE